MKQTTPETENNTVCPVCVKYTFDGIFDLCKVCFWEHDPWQEEDSTLDGGSNNLCLNDYKKRWEKLNAVMPTLIKKYEIQISKTAHWTYDKMIVPRKNIKAFLYELTENGIEACLSFYNICERYNFNPHTFVGYPYTYGETAEESNQKCLDIIFTDGPLKVCEEHHLKQISKILKKSKNKAETWEALTPYICIAPNPDHL